MFADISKLETIAQVLAHAERFATMLTVHRDGSFDAYFDDKAQDTRVVVRCHAGHAHITLKAMHGFNAERNEWQVSGREGRREYANKRGQSATIKAYRRLADSLKGYFPALLSMYRRSSGEWYAV